MNLIQGQNTPLMYKSKFNLAEVSDFSAWLTIMGEKEIEWNELKVVDGEYVQLMLSQSQTLNLRCGAATLDAKYVIDGAVCFEKTMEVEIIDRDNDTVLSAGESDKETGIEEAEPVVMPIYNKGLDGVSPVVDMERIGDRLKITIVDKDGEHIAFLYDGEKGNDGIPPTVTITKENALTVITITDADGTTHSAEILDGHDYNLTEADKQHIASLVHVEEKHITEYIENPYNDSEIKKELSDTKTDLLQVSNIVGESPASEITGEYLLQVCKESVAIWEKLAPMLMALPSEEQGQIIVQRIKAINQTLEYIIAQKGEQL